MTLLYHKASAVSMLGKLFLKDIVENNPKIFERIEGGEKALQEI